MGIPIITCPDWQIRLSVGVVEDKLTDVAPTNRLLARSPRLIFCMAYAALWRKVICTWHTGGGFTGVRC